MMDLRLIRQLVRIMTGSGVTELEVDDAKEGVRLRLKRGAEQSAAPAASMVQLVPGAATAPAPGAGEREERRAPAAPASNLHQISSPMVGTFYRASSPEAEPFVEPGRRIVEDSVICIIEAMKVMNEIRAEVRGEIAEILVENGEPVEFGQPLFLVRRT
jgi:acetyl-CoA carboxylase biotin carboxyl carrier protein